MVPAPAAMPEEVVFVASDREFSNEALLSASVASSLSVSLSISDDTLPAVSLSDSAVTPPSVSLSISDDTLPAVSSSDSVVSSISVSVTDSSSSLPVLMISMPHCSEPSSGVPIASAIPIGRIARNTLKIPVTMIRPKYCFRNNRKA